VIYEPAGFPGPDLTHPPMLTLLSKAARGKRPPTRANVAIGVRFASRDGSRRAWQRYRRSVRAGSTSSIRRVRPDGRAARRRLSGKARQAPRFDDHKTNGRLAVPWVDACIHSLAVGVVMSGAFSRTICCSPRRQQARRRAAWAKPERDGFIERSRDDRLDREFGVFVGETFENLVEPLALGAF
jgi:hypothetical protein